MSDHWIQTRTGKAIDFADSVEDLAKQICLEDMAHALGGLNRYTGHGAFMFPVARHCLLVADHLPKELRLEGLLHDAAEAYVGDVSRPLKRYLRGAYCMSEYDRLEEKFTRAIQLWAGLPVTGDWPDAVQVADLRALATERLVLLGKSPRDWKLTLPPFDDMKDFRWRLDAVGSVSGEVWRIAMLGELQDRGLR